MQEHVDLGSEEHAWWAAKSDLLDEPPTAEPFDEMGDPAAIHDSYFGKSAPRPGNDEVHFPDPRDDPYHVLGIPPGAPWETVSARFRYLAVEHHPDKTHGLSPEARERSERYIRDVNTAYSELRRRAGR